MSETCSNSYCREVQNCLVCGKRDGVTPSPVVSDEVVGRMKEALRTLVYEATHLSPMEDDGSHWAKISKDALGNARTILQEVSRS